jgi:hypothetical protein
MRRALFIASTFTTVTAAGLALSVGPAWLWALVFVAFASAVFSSPIAPSGWLNGGVEGPYSGDGGFGGH